MFRLYVCQSTFSGEVISFIGCGKMGFSDRPVTVMRPDVNSGHEKTHAACCLL